MLRDFAFTENRKLKTENCLLSLPATAWPGPQALQGTPARLSPGLGPAGCGWGLLTTGSDSLSSNPKSGRPEPRPTCGTGA